MNYPMAAAADQPQNRPHQLPLHSSNSEVNGALSREVKTWNPFEDTFTQMSEDHLFGQEFDKIRQLGSQSSESSSVIAFVYLADYDLFLIKFPFFIKISRNKL